MATEQKTKAPASDGASAERRHAFASPTTARARATSSRSPTGPSATMDLRQIKVYDDDFGLMGYDPAFTQHRLLPLGDHLHRRRGGDPPAPRDSRSSSSASTRPISRSPTC